jgi:hypothetical protein
MFDWFDRAGEPNWAEQWPFSGRVLGDKSCGAMRSSPHHRKQLSFTACCSVSVHLFHVYGSIKSTQKSDSLCAMPGTKNNGELSGCP